MRQKWTHGRMVAKMTQAEAAEQLGMTRQVVQQHERSALAKLRAGLLEFEEVREMVGEGEEGTEARRHEGQGVSDGTGISWADATWNPVVGCTRVSAGCDHCYAVGMSHRIACAAEADVAAGREPGAKRNYVGLTVRIVSCEPLLGEIDMCEWLARWHCDYCGALYAEYVNGCPRCHFGEVGTSSSVRLAKIHQVIVGGESGAKARPCDVAWIRSIRDQCAAAGVACWVKQLGARIAVRNDEFSQWPDDGDGVIYDAEGPGWSYQGETVVVRTNDRAGADMAEWPEDLRVQEEASGESRGRESGKAGMR